MLQNCKSPASIVDDDIEFSVIIQITHDNRERIGAEVVSEVEPLR